MPRRVRPWEEGAGTAASGVRGPEAARLDVEIEKHGIRFCWDNLWSPSADGEKARRICLDMPDTVILKPETRDVDRWLFTSGKSGEILKKSSRTVGARPLRFARHTFAGDALADVANIKNIAAFIYYEDGSRRPVVSGELDFVANETTGRNFAAIQKYVCPKGGEHSALLRTEYTVDKNGVTFTCTTHRVTLGAESKLAKKILLRASAINRDIERTAASVVKHINKSTGLKVIFSEMEFALDKNEKLWFLSAPVMRTVKPISKYKLEGPKPFQIPRCEALYALAPEGDGIRKHKKKKKDGVELSPVKGEASLSPAVLPLKENLLEDLYYFL